MRKQQATLVFLENKIRHLQGQHAPDASDPALKAVKETLKQTQEQLDEMTKTMEGLRTKLKEKDIGMFSKCISHGH
jgi:uncharacterized coiled-coil protein SlyX